MRDMPLCCVLQHILAAITLLKKKYAGWRAVLDDGNSFYRSLFMGFLEHCVQSGNGDPVILLCDRWGGGCVA